MIRHGFLPSIYLFFFFSSLELHFSGYLLLPDIHLVCTWPIGVFGCYSLLLSSSTVCMLSAIFLCQCFVFTHRKNETESSWPKTNAFRSTFFPLILSHCPILFAQIVRGCYPYRKILCINRKIFDAKCETFRASAAAAFPTHPTVQYIWNRFALVCEKELTSENSVVKIFSGNQEHNSMEWIKIMFVLINERHQRQLDAPLRYSYHHFIVLSKWQKRITSRWEEWVNECIGVNERQCEATAYKKKFRQNLNFMYFLWMV